MKLGMEGLGIYWCIIEILYENDGKVCLSEIETIAYELRMDSERIADVLKNYGLFKFKDDYLYSESVDKRIRLREEKSEQARQSALISWESRRKGDANAKRTHSSRNAIKVKESKVKKREYRDNVKLTEKEHQTLLDKDGKTAVTWMLDKLSNYKLANGKTYKSDYGAINSWVRDEFKKQNPEDTPKALPYA